MKREKRFTKQEWSWILFDWANSVWATNISAAIFPIFFAMKATGQGNAIYGYVVSFANLAVAVLSPYMGAFGDFKGMKKKLWMAFLLIGVIFTAVMGLVGSWQWMLVGFVFARIGYSGSSLFYDSFLTDVTTTERMDKVSTWGFAMGYIGGSTIPFLLSIIIMLLMDMSELSYRIAILIVPVWWFVFSIPFMRNVEQKYFVTTPPGQIARKAWRNMIATLKEIGQNRAVLLFLLAYFFYIDGVDTIISMSTNYGSTLGLGTIGMILALVVTQLVAVPFSILFGKWTKRIGSLKLICLSVGMYTLITLVGAAMGFLIDFRDMLGFTMEEAISVSTVLFWVLATMVGTVQGGIQALSRSYYAQLIPPERSNEYFGFMDIFGKFACVVGPALYALFYNLTEKPSIGILSLAILFALAGFMLAIGWPDFKAASAKNAATNAK